MADNTTIEIDKETHVLVRQYCVINSIPIKEFIRGLVSEELHEFKKRIESVRKIK